MQKYINISLVIHICHARRYYCLEIRAGLQRCAKLDWTCVHYSSSADSIGSSWVHPSAAEFPPVHLPENKPKKVLGI